MNLTTPGLPVDHQIPGFTQTHDHWVSDAIRPSHPLSSPSPALNLSQHQDLFKWVNDRMISVCFQGKPFNITVIQVYAPTSNTEVAEVEWFYEDLQDILELTLPQKYPFHYRGLKCKSRSSRNTWSNRQIWPWNTELSRARIIEFCQKNALVIANTLFQQHKRRLYTWTSPDGPHQNQTDSILCR